MKIDRSKLIKVQPENIQSDIVYPFAIYAHLTINDKILQLTQANESIETDRLKKYLTKNSVLLLVDSDAYNQYISSTRTIAQPDSSATATSLSAIANSDPATTLGSIETVDSAKQKYNSTSEYDIEKIAGKVLVENATAIVSDSEAQPDIANIIAAELAAEEAAQALAADKSTSEEEDSLATDAAEKIDAEIVSGTLEDDSDAKEDISKKSKSHDDLKITDPVQALIDSLQELTVAIQNQTIEKLNTQESISLPSLLASNRFLPCIKAIISIKDIARNALERIEYLGKNKSIQANKDFFNDEYPEIIRGILQECEKELSIQNSDSNEKSQSSAEILASLSESTANSFFPAEFIATINDSNAAPEDSLEKISLYSEEVQDEALRYYAKLKDSLYSDEFKAAHKKESDSNTEEQLVTGDESEPDDEFVFSLVNIEEAISIVAGSQGHGEEKKKFSLRDAEKPAILEYKRIIVAHSLAKLIENEQKSILQLLSADKPDLALISSKRESTEKLRALLGIIKINAELDLEKNPILNEILSANYNESHLDRDITVVAKSIAQLKSNMASMRVSISKSDNKIEAIISGNSETSENEKNKVVRNKENSDYAFCSIATQISLAIGYTHKEFIRDTVLAGLVYRNKFSPRQSELPSWTNKVIKAQNDLEKSWDELANRYDSAMLNSLQILSLADIYTSQFLANSTAIRIDPEKFALLLDNLKLEDRWQNVCLDFFRDGAARPHTPDRTNFYFEIASETKRIADKFGRPNSRH